MSCLIGKTGMRLVVASIAVLSCGIVICPSTGCAAATKPANSMVKRGATSEQTLIGVLAPAFMKQGKGGRVYFATTCPQDENNSVQLSSSVALPFPLVDMTGSAIGDLQLSTVRNLFRNAREVTVYKNGNGLISLDIGDVDKRILHVKISSLKLSPTAQYTPELAIDEILNSGNINRGDHRMGVRPVANTYIISVIAPAKGLRHLPSVINNVTLDQAFDMVATAFNGLVLYGSCSNRHLYGAKFVGGTYFDGGVHANDRGGF